MIPDLMSFHAIVVNTSAGKDSQAMMDYVWRLCRELGVVHRMVALHCDLGLSPRGEPIEWPGTAELAQEHAERYGIRFLVAKRQRRGFLEEVADRGMWPDSMARYCTSYFKRDPGKKVLTKLAAEVRHFAKVKRPRLLNCFGFRAEESSRRKKLQPFTENAKCCTSRKEVWDWLPIHTWSLDDVWTTIAMAGTKPHYAYSLGMTRLSCRFCIFAPKSQLALSARHNPALFAEYVQLENEIGHKFRKALPLAEVALAVAAGEKFETDDGCWNM